MQLDYRFLDTVFRCTVVMFTSIDYLGLSQSLAPLLALTFSIDNNIVSSDSAPAGVCTPPSVRGIEVCVSSLRKYQQPLTSDRSTHTAASYNHHRHRRRVGVANLARTDLTHPRDAPVSAAQYTWQQQLNQGLDRSPRAAASVSDTE